YPYVNGLATYTAPISLVFCSRKVRMLMHFRITEKSRIASGFCGILAVIAHVIAAKFSYSPDQHWIFRFGWMLSHIGALGSLIGKTIIVSHRFAVLRSINLCENVCSKTIAFCPANAVLQIQRALTTPCYLLYIGASCILTALTSRALAKLARLAHVIQNSASIIRQQRVMFVVVAVCTLSHLIKATHQIVWTFCVTFDMQQAENVIWPLYPYVNGLATYTAPISLVFCSRKVRKLM
ncbi:hypothetical protein PFISCL1PPCAC_7470, partial [Pristionchus fissidentatus]